MGGGAGGPVLPAVHRAKCAQPTLPSTPELSRGLVYPMPRRAERARRRGHCDHASRPPIRRDACCGERWWVAQCGYVWGGKRGCVQASTSSLGGAGAARTAAASAGHMHNAATPLPYTLPPRVQRGGGQACCRQEARPCPQGMRQGRLHPSCTPQAPASRATPLLHFLVKNDIIFFCPAAAAAAPLLPFFAAAAAGLAGAAAGAAGAAGLGCRVAGREGGRSAHQLACVPVCVMCMHTFDAYSPRTSPDTTSWRSHSHALP